MYFTFLLMIIPLIANVVDRVALPAHNSDYIGPANYMTIVLGRNYVKNDLYKAVIEGAVDFGKKYPDTKITYLDAGFAVSSWIPMLPHSSHNTGKSLDFGFVYNDADGEVKSGSPSWTGYGVYAQDKLTNNQKKCFKENSLYGFTKYVGLTIGKGEYVLDKRLTRDLIQSMHKQKKISKIFLEPYLKSSFGLKNYKKIKFHGCESVRHDDHFHVQID